jgi:hypothetical protein
MLEPRHLDLTHDIVDLGFKENTGAIAFSARDKVIDSVARLDFEII